MMDKKAQLEKQTFDKLVVGAVITTIIIVFIPIILSSLNVLSATGIILSVLFSVVVAVVLTAKIFMFLVDFFKNG